MPATITRMSVAPAFSVANVSYIKNIMTSLGVSTGNIVYETTTEAIYKITNGAGTYADTYLRFTTATGTLNGSSGTYWSVQTGTGISANALTGAGTAVPAMGINSSGALVTYATYYTTVVSSDGSYRQFMHFDSNSVYRGGFSIVQPTNTTLTAAACPLTYVYSGNLVLNPSLSALYQVPSVATAQYGPVTATRYLALSNTTTIATTFGLTTARAGAYGVQPNVPIQSGGWNIGYNTNLGFTNSGFAVLDRIIVSPGVEEWIVCDTGTGLAVREV